MKITLTTWNQIDNKLFYYCIYCDTVVAEYETDDHGYPIRKLFNITKDHVCEYEYDNWDVDDDYDWCYECTGLGDDYYIDDNGKLECRCIGCKYNNWPQSVMDKIIGGNKNDGQLGRVTGDNP